MELFQWPLLMLTHTGIANSSQNSMEKWLFKDFDFDSLYPHVPLCFVNILVIEIAVINQGKIDFKDLHSYQVNALSS